jgi:hypothetical protein
MRLKASTETAVFDLREGGGADWLGYRLSQGRGGLEVNLTVKAWRSLGRNLELAHHKVGSPVRAAETIKGWISQMGPCFQTEDFDEAYARIGALALELSFDEIPSPEEVRRLWQRASERWEGRREGGKGHREAARGSATRDLGAGRTPPAGAAS